MYIIKYDIHILSKIYGYNRAIHIVIFIKVNNNVFLSCNLYFMDNMNISKLLYNKYLQMKQEIAIY